MSHRSPKPISSQDRLSGTALRRLVDLSEIGEQQQREVTEMLQPDARRFTDRWLALIGDTVAMTTVTPAWVYSVTPVLLTLTIDAGNGKLTATTTEADTGDLGMLGNAYNLREIKNTAGAADGIDTTGLPGTFAVLPVSGIVECWHQLISNGTYVIMFSERNPIDGVCDS